MKRVVEGVARDQSGLFPAHLEDFVAEDNPVRVVDAFVDGLDLRELGFASTDPAATGRPGYHPAVLVKLYIYGYLNRVPSSRRLEREAAKEVPLGETFERLRDRCVDLQVFYNMYHHLYEAGEEVSEVLRCTAHYFFHDLNKILFEQIYLQVSRITDPARTAGRENLCVANIDEMLEDVGIVTGEIRRLSAELMRYRNITKDVRNRVTAHLDKETFVNDLEVGGHPAEEVTAFFENLYDYCGEVGRVTGQGSADFRTLAARGDVLDLIKALERSLET